MKKRGRRSITRHVRANSQLVRAYHEAGHVVMAKSLGWRVDFASIVLDLDGSKFGTPGRQGVVQLARDPIITFREHVDRIAAKPRMPSAWDEWRHNFSRMQRAVRRYTQFAMGGMAALKVYEEREDVILPKRFTYGADEDYERASAFADTICENRDKAMLFIARALVSDMRRMSEPANWSRISRVAAALVTHRTLSGKELNALM